MTTRRGFLQTVGAALGSTMLPAGAIATVVTAAPVAEVAAGVMAVAAVARQFRVQGGIIDAATFEPKTSIVLFNPDGSWFTEDVMYSEILDDLDDPARRAEAEELDKLYPDSNVHRRWSVLATRIILEKQGMPPLTPEEEIQILEGKQPVFDTAEA